MITINTPFLEQNCESIYLKSNIVDEVQNINEIVWFQTSLEFGKFFVDEVADPFLVALVMPAIRYKEDITVNAKVSEQLYYNLVHYVIPYISASWGGYMPRIMVKGLTSRNYNPQASATGCSMGVDSLSAIFHHIDKNCPDGYKLTHLTFFNVGSHGTINLKETEASFYKDLSLVQNFASILGLPVVWVNTNMHLLYFDFSFNHSHTMRNMSVVLSMQKLFYRYYYASSYTLYDYALKQDNTAYYEDPLLSRLTTESTSMMSEDATWERSQKTKYIADNKLAQEHLYVCLKEQISNNGYDKGLDHLKDNWKNCSRCTKCLRTMITLDIIGKLDKFNKIFDVEYFYRIKKYYIGKVLSQRSHDLLFNDIYKLMKSEGYQIPLFSKVISVFYVLYIKLSPKKLQKYVLHHLRNR